MKMSYIALIINLMVGTSIVLAHSGAVHGPLTAQAWGKKGFTPDISDSYITKTIFHISAAIPVSITMYKNPNIDLATSL